MVTQFSENIFCVSISVISSIYLLYAFIFFLELSILYLFSVLSTSVRKNTHWLTLHNQYNRSVCSLRSVGFSFSLIYLASMHTEPILNTKGNPICLQTYFDIIETISSISVRVCRTSHFIPNIGGCEAECLLSCQIQFSNMIAVNDLWSWIKYS